MQPLEKLSTGVKNLDRILNGGIPKFSRDGIQMYPRITTPEKPPYYTVGETSIPTGIEGLDTMMNGGFPRNSVTMDGNVVALYGGATTNSSATRYAVLLEETGAFSTVHIASLTTANGPTGPGVTTFSMVVNR